MMISMVRSNDKDEGEKDGADGDDGVRKKMMKKMMSRMALMAGRPSNDGCGRGADQESCAPLILLLRSCAITLKL